MAASIFALPHLPARREVQDVVGSCCLLQGRPTEGRVFLRPVPGGESAGCVRLQLLFCGLCACLFFACHAHCPSQVLAPARVSLLRQVSFASFAPVHCHVRQDRRLGPAVC